MAASGGLPGSAGAAGAAGGGAAGGSSGGQSAIGGAGGHAGSGTAGSTIGGAGGHAGSGTAGSAIGGAGGHAGSGTAGSTAGGAGGHAGSGTAGTSAPGGAQGTAASNGISFVYTAISVGGVPGDVNGDGKMDMVDLQPANGAGARGRLNVWIGSGDGHFTGPAGYAVRDPQLVVVGDLTGDGKGDLVALSNVDANTRATTFSVLLNKGNGTFGAAVEYPAVDDASRIKIADVNGDGRSDLVVSGFDTFSVFMNLGQGAFAPGVPYKLESHAAGSSFSDLAIGDLTADGRPEIVLVPDGVDALPLFINQGDGRFVQDAYVSTDSFPDAVVIVDLNGDGKGDLVVQTFGGNIILLNQGAPFFTKTVVQDFYPTQPLFAVDLNGDGHADVVCETGVYPGNGDGTLAQLVTYSATNTMARALGDLNGDGKPDIVLGDGILVNSTPWPAP